MKKLSSLLLVFIMLLPCIVSCGSDDDDNDNDVKTNDSYYVKYEVKNGYKYVAMGALTSVWDITYTDVNGSGTVKATDKWEGTYGPFKKGDTVTLKATITRSTYYTDASISVSRNNENFAIKARGGGQYGANLSYTIDY